MHYLLFLFARSKAAASATAAQGISIPYGYTGGFVSGLPIDQGLRPAAYPFLMPTGQYVTQMPYPQQVREMEFHCTSSLPLSLSHSLSLSLSLF